MDGHEPAIKGQVDVDFDGIGALRPGEADGGEGIFRSVKGSAAMTDDFHGSMLNITGGDSKRIFKRHCECYFSENLFCIFLRLR
jgi:hypothetical protein